MKPYSLKERVKVKILPAGYAMLAKRFPDPKIKNVVMKVFKPDEDGYTTMPMYLVCFYFGQQMMQGAPEFPIEMEILVH